MAGSSKFDPAVDYYALLQVHPTAHPEVIKRAYRAIIGLLQVHPDLGGRHEDAVRLNEAYAVLADPSLRRAYDMARRAQEAEAGTTLHCVHCGTRNRLPAGTDAARSVCGRCRRLLISAPAPEIPTPELPLSPVLTTALTRSGELRIERTRVPADGRLRCLRCRFSWSAGSGRPPARCPRCHSRHWGEFRLFACRACGHRFLAADLTSWPYTLYPACPACHQPHWHPGCERHPLRWVFNLLTA